MAQVDWEDGWFREERLFLFGDCDDRVSIRQEALDEEGYETSSTNGGDDEE